MDKEQEDLHLLGAFGIFKESFELIVTCPKIFMKITLALILPLSCIFLVHFGISTFLSNRMINITSVLNIYDSHSSELITYWLFNVLYLVFSVVFSLLSISAVVYTVACIYIGKIPNFKNTMSVVPKVWKRLMITFLCNFCILFVFNLVSIFVLAILVPMFFGAAMSSKFSSSQKSNDGLVVGLAILLCIVLLIYFAGWVYLSIVWQLANVISITENHCGFRALAKSKKLIKGKMGTAIGIFFLLGLSSLPNYFLLMQLGGNDERLVGFGERICYGSLSLVWMTFLFLLTHVLHTIFYFVCKSHHHEKIYKPLLANHLEAYLGEYAPLKSIDNVEIQIFHV